MRSGRSLCGVSFSQMTLRSVVRVGNNWKRSRRGGGMQWREKEKSLETRKNKCVCEREGDGCKSDAACSRCFEDR